MTMTQTTDFLTLFTAFHNAQAAYRRLSAKGRAMSDRELAHDPDYLLLHRSGMLIARLGGEEAMRGAIQSLCHAGDADAACVRSDLERFWAGMDGRPH